MTIAWATIIASVFAVFSHPYNYYRCWLSWSGGSAVAGLLFYLLVTGGGGGLLGWLIAEGSRAHPTSNDAANGILFGITGSLLLRADLKPSRAQVPYLRDAVTLLSACAKPFAEQMDKLALEAAEEWYFRLPVDSLRDQAVRINAHMGAQLSSKTPNQAKVEFSKVMAEHLRLFRSRQDAAAQTGRAGLAITCSTYRIREHQRKPAL